MKIAWTAAALAVVVIPMGATILIADNLHAHNTPTNKTHESINLKEMVTNSIKNTKTGLTSCDVLSPKARYDCTQQDIYIQAIQQIDSTMCDAIDTPTHAHACRQEVAFNSAIRTGDGAHCDGITDMRTKDRCTSLFDTP